MALTASTVARNEIFNPAVAHLGRYLTDNERIPHFNPSDSTVVIQPGELILKQWGATTANTSDTNDTFVFMAQGPIFPGEIGYLIRNFKAEFDCDLSANAVQGDQIYWDIDDKELKLVGDVTNGFLAGMADFVLDPNLKNTALTVDSDDRVVCGTSSSTKLVIQSQDAATTIKGTVSAYAVASSAAKVSGREGLTTFQAKESKFKK